MFAIATKNFVSEVDKGGLLIPVSSLNDTIVLLTVVVKRKRFWFWQKPKYLPTDFILGDLLTGDTPITPAVLEAEFIKYSGTYGDVLLGTVGATFAKVSVNMEGKDSSKLQSTFGSLKKEEVDVQKLLKDCKDRVLDMSHSLIQQTKKKHRRVFGIVKERIVTTQPCSVIEEVQQGGGVLTSCGPNIPKFSLKENGKLNKDSNITMEIPTHTTLAYGLLELEIRQDGQFELCLMSDTNGGFEVDSHVATEELACVSGAPGGKHLLQQELENLRDYFQVLSALPASSSSALLQQISELMQDPAAITALLTALDQMYLDEKPELGDPGSTESQQQKIQEILALLEISGQAESNQRKSVHMALYLLISALDELTNDCLCVLRACSLPPALQTLELLVQCVSTDTEMNLSSLELTEDLFKKMEHLFASCNMCLKKDSDVLRTEIRHQAENLPLILCIAIRSLASLAHSS